MLEARGTPTLCSRFAKNGHAVRAAADSWREQAWVLKKSVSGESAVKIGDLKCIPDQRKSFIGHPGAK